MEPTSKTVALPVYLAQCSDKLFFIGQCLVSNKERRAGMETRSGICVFQFSYPYGRLCHYLANNLDKKDHEVQGRWPPRVSAGRNGPNSHAFRAQDYWKCESDF